MENTLTTSQVNDIESIAEKLSKKEIKSMKDSNSLHDFLFMKLGISFNGAQLNKAVEIMLKTKI